jgi:hypothetical protein
MFPSDFSLCQTRLCEFVTLAKVRQIVSLLVDPGSSPQGISAATGKKDHDDKAEDTRQNA